MKTNKKKLIKDKELEQVDLDETGVSFARSEMIRVYAVGLTFRDISFKQAVINECYFRNCTFVKCDFTGANIQSTNMQGASFDGCEFRYVQFRQTEVGIDPIGKNLPPQENLKQSLAKNLRMNYASLGDYEGVNFAIRIELAATMVHLRKAAFCRESYYRNKPEYQKLGRLRYALKFIWFWLLDKLWGNGEHPGRMLISIPVMLFGFAGLIALSNNDTLSQSILSSWSVFLLGANDATLGLGWLMALSLLRYIVLGLFVSSIVRRLSRR